MTDDNREASILSRSSEFVRIAGLRFDEIGGRRIRGFIELGEHHHTPWGVAHGGGRDHGQRGGFEIVDMPARAALCAIPAHIVPDPMTAISTLRAS